MQCTSIRPETGSTSKTSPSSCTSPSSPTANYLSQCVNSTKRHSSRSPGRQLCHHHSQSCRISHSPSCSPNHSTLPHQSHQTHCQQIPHRYSQDSIDIILTDCIVTTDQQPKGSLFTERASDGQRAIFT